MLVLVVIVDNCLSQVYKINSYHEGHQLIIDDFHETFEKHISVSQVEQIKNTNSLQYVDTLFHTKYNWVIKEVSER
jgi:single-stranded DNA-specific DHH superfamily exonuclease